MPESPIRKQALEALQDELADVVIWDEALSDQRSLDLYLVDVLSCTMRYLKYFTPYDAREIGLILQPTEILL